MGLIFIQLIQIIHTSSQKVFSVDIFKGVVVGNRNVMLKYINKMRENI